MGITRQDLSAATLRQAAARSRDANAARRLLAVTHILDWFHISMRVRHVEQSLAGLLASELEDKGPLHYA